MGDSEEGDGSPDPFAFDEERSGDDPADRADRAEPDARPDDPPNPATGGEPSGGEGPVDDAGPPRVENPFSEGAGTDPPGEDADGGDDRPAVDIDADGPARDRGDAPFGDLAAAVGERRRRDDESDPFEEVDVDDVDEDELWASLAGEDGGAEEATAAANAVSDDRADHVVDKRQYCQRCPFLSAPPDVVCGHEGTEIVEAVDADRFRVRGCPMVTEGGRPNFAVGDDAPIGADPAAAAEVTDGAVGDGAADDPVGTDGPGAAGPDA
ncbi:hypothetical protein BRC97_00965 [Halobacteriales archaeon QS_6_71_20]|nr:MAG: hypothetical protein BRC97_00965 [Halobacteriales archaeon QS_6_71_20]